MVESDSNNKFAGTYRKLFDTIERGVEQCSTDQLQTILEEKRSQLKLGLDYYTPASSQSRSKLTSTVTVDGKQISIDQKERELIIKVSDMINLNEVQCVTLWEAYKQENKRFVDCAKSSEFALDKNAELIMEVVSFYFEDRLSFLNCIGSLQRLSLQKEHPFNTFASNIVNTLHQDTTQNTSFVYRLLAQFSNRVRTQVPTRHCSFPGWIEVWATQNLKEQKALLEIIFLFSITTSFLPDFILAFIQELEVNNFGTFQIFSYALDEEGVKIRDQVTNLCSLIAVSIIITPDLTQDNQLNPAEIDKILINTPTMITKINQIVLLMGDDQKHSVFLLAWSYFLSRVRATIGESDPEQAKLLLEGRPMLAPSVISDRSFARAAGFDIPDERTIHIQRTDHLERTLIGRSLKLNVFDNIQSILESGICDEDDMNNFGYRSVLRLLMKSFLSTTLPQFIPMESYSRLIDCYCSVYQEQADLCTAFWKEDVDKNNQNVLINTTLGRFPVYFTHFTNLLSSLTFTSELDLGAQEKPADRVYEYLCQLPTITVVLKNDFYALAVVENDMPVIYIDQSLRITPALNYITGIQVSEKSRGVLLSATQDNRIVQFAESYSGWHILVSVLANSIKQHRGNVVDVQDEEFVLTGGNPEAIVSILNIIFRVLSNNPKLVPCLVDHVQTTAAVPGMNYTTPILVSVLCDVLTFSSSVKSCPIPIITLAVKCIHMLLPHYRKHIWTYLKTSPIIPRILSATKPSNYASKFTLSASHMSQISQIVAKFECSVGTYDLLLAFLDLVHGLVRDIQGNWWTREANMVDYQAQMDTLYTCLHFLMLDVFPAFSGWRYKKLYERFLIGSKLVSIFIEICNYFKESPSLPETQLSLNGIRDGLFNNFLYTENFHHISPLLDTISVNADKAKALYKSSRIKEAQLAEEMSILTFVFVKLLLQQRLEDLNKGTAHPKSTLERLIFERPGQNGCSDFLLRIVKHIDYRYNMTLPIQATNTLSLLCQTTSAWETVPSFVQHLGDTAEAHAVIRSYLVIAKDDSQSETMLSAVWQLITSLLETQPSLAILFLDCGDFIMPSPKSAVRLLNNQTSATNTSTDVVVDSAIRAAVDILDKWESLSVEKPAVMSNVLRFLSTFWKTAFDHYALVERTRSDSALWAALEKVLLNPMMEVDTSSTILENINLLEVAFSEEDRYDLSVRQICCGNLSKAFAMRIVAYEMHLTAGSERAKKTPSAVKTLPVGLKNLLTKISEPAKLSQMRAEFIKNDFNPQLAQLTNNVATTLLQAIGISTPFALLFKAPLSGSGDDGVPGEIRQYGDSYLYNLRMTVSRVFSFYGDIREKYNLSQRENMLVTPEINAALDTERLCNSLLRHVVEANHNYSIVDSQMVLLRSFRTFVETCSHHASDLIWVTKGNTSSSDNLCQFICDLIQQAKNKNRADGVTLTAYSGLVHSVRNLIEDWIEKFKNVLLGQDTTAKERYSLQVSEIMSSLCDLLERENFALMQSVYDETAVRFHRPLLESVLLFICTLRGPLTCVNESAKLGIQACIKKVLPVICSSFQVLCIKATSFSAEGSAASEGDMDDCIKDVTIVTSLLQEIIKSRYGVEEDIWLSKFTTHHTFTSLLKLFYGGVELMIKEIDSQTTCSDRLYSLNITPFTETALYFLLTLSNIPKAARLLVENHAFDALTNNNLTARLQQGTLDLFIRFGDKTKREPGYVERNPLHFAWCQILNVISSLLRTIGDSEEVLRSTINLLQMCGPQIGKTFEKSNSPSDSLFALVPLESLSVPLLEELESIHSVFYELSKYLERIPNLATNLLKSYKDCSLLLLQRYLYFFTHPSHMKAQLYRTNPSETADEFMRKTNKSLLNITHSMMSTLVVLTHANVVLTAPDIEWPFGNTIIHPEMQASTYATSSFGTLVECINAGMLMVNQWQDSEDEPLVQALDVIQSCSFMLTSQTALWVAKPGIENDVRMVIATDNIMDIVEVLAKVESTLEKLTEKKAAGNVNARIRLINMLLTFLSKRFLEN